MKCWESSARCGYHYWAFGAAFWGMERFACVWADQGAHMALAHLHDDPDLDSIDLKDKARWMTMAFADLPFVHIEILPDLVSLLIKTIIKIWALKKSMILAGFANNDIPSWARLADKAETVALWYVYGWNPSVCRLWFTFTCGDHATPTRFW